MGVRVHTVLKMCHHSSVINRHTYTTPYHHTDKHIYHTHTYIPANGQVSRVPKAMQADTLYGFWDRQSLIHSWKCLDENVLVAWGKTESKIQTNRQTKSKIQTNKINNKNHFTACHQRKVFQQSPPQAFQLIPFSVTL